MEFDATIEYLRMAFWPVIITSCPILGIALGVGLENGILHAATSINEMKLSFVRKLIFVFGGCVWLSGFMLRQLADFFAYIFETISGLG